MRRILKQIRIFIFVIKCPLYVFYPYCVWFHTSAASVNGTSHKKLTERVGSPKVKKGFAQLKGYQGETFEWWKWENDRNDAVVSFRSPLPSFLQTVSPDRQYPVKSSRELCICSTPLLKIFRHPFF